MCLGIPGRILHRWEADDGQLLARADFAGEVRLIRLNYLPDLAVDDYTIVHAGFALTRIDEAEANRTLAVMREVGLLASDTTPQPSTTSNTSNTSNSTTSNPSA